MKKLILFLLVFTASLSFASAQWQSTHGPSNFNITCIAVSGTYLFAGTGGGGVFLSTDSGTTWTAINNGLTDTVVTSLAVSGINIFAGTGNGVFLSNNNGGIWTVVNNGLTNTNIASLAASGTNLFAGTLGDGVFLSADTGANWTPVNNGFNGSNISSLGVSGTSIFAGTLGGYVNLSTDTGSNWANIGQLNGAISSFAISGTNIFVGTMGGAFGVFLSTNTGSTWTVIDSGLLNTNVTSLAISGTNIFAGTTGGVFLTTNTSSSNWSAINKGLADSAIFSLATSATNIFLGSDTAGVWKSSLSNLLSCTPVINALSSTGIFCGGSVTLSNSIGSGYLWSDGETTQSITVTAAGNYSCNVTTGCGNSTSNVIGVTSLSYELISASGATIFCQGDTVTLTVNNNANSYLWSDGETTQIIVVSTTGNYSCNVSTNCGLENTNTITVTVNPTPLATITPGAVIDTLCQGSTLIANENKPWYIYNGYLWSNGATTSSINVSTSQIYSVTITDDNGCTASAETNITSIPSPLPIITSGGATAVCDGDSVMLSSSAAIGYYWSTGATTQSITVKSTNNYSVTVTNPNGCPANSSNTQVIIHSIPVPPIIKPSNNSLSSSFATGNQWYFNGDIISGATGQFYVPSQNGIYTVEYTNSNGCFSISAPFNLTNVGITELINDNSFLIYPNPAGNQLTVIIANEVKRSPTIEVYNTLGEKVFSTSLSFGDGQGEAVIDVSSLPSGMYFLQMKTESAIATQRFVKE